MTFWDRHKKGFNFMQSDILLFVLFSIISAVIMYFIPVKYKKYMLLFLNVLFYSLCDFRFLFLIFLGIVWSYYIGRFIINNPKLRKLYLCFGIFPIVVILCFFKYYNFFVPEGEDVLKIVMPLGISYYTFKIISYMVDVYQRKQSIEDTFVEYATYVSFFPQIICGPISRSEDIMGQLRHLSRISSELMSDGIGLILSGLFKKLVIADRLNIYVNTIFTNPSGYPALALWMAAFFYTIQIYCDFAGYSEIAIGVANLLGIKCKANFQLPYFSYSIKDFWRRWHISLSSWLRDYIYIPLGGNRKGVLHKNINIILTFLLSGIWHGTGINYLFWGIYHGFFNLFNYKRASSVWKSVLQITVTFIVVMFGWIFFKAATLQTAFSYIASMFINFRISLETIVASVLPFTGDFSCLAYLLCVCLFIIILFVMEYRDFVGRVRDIKKAKTVRTVIYISSVILFGVIGQSSFLYANF